MKKIAIISPLRGNHFRSQADNIERAKHLCLLAARASHAPFAGHVFYTNFLDDLIPEDRERGMAAFRAWIEVADQVWVDTKFGISDGMRRDISWAERHGRIVIYDPPEFS